jgi:hypothetical protein
VIESDKTAHPSDDEVDEVELDDFEVPFDDEGLLPPFCFDSGIALLKAFALKSREALNLKGKGMVISPMNSKGT